MANDSSEHRHTRETASPIPPPETAAAGSAPLRNEASAAQSPTARDSLAAGAARDSAASAAYTESGGGDVRNDGATPAKGAASPSNGKSSTRKRALLGVGAVVLVAAIGYGVYWALVLNHYESTDNAYVQGNVVQITPQISGTVVAINADDTDHVKAGQVVVKLDPADAQVALNQAEAQLAQTVREVRTVYANNNTLQSQISARAADVARAEADLAKAQDDVARRAPLVATGAVGKEEFAHATAQLNAARSAVAAAQSARRAAEEQLASNQTQTEGTPVDQHPSVQRAAAQVHEAYLALQRSDLRAPVDGFVAKRSVQLGQRVQAGTPLMSVIALSQVWVEANFKESQIKNLRIGQPTELIADVYGRKVIYHGTIEGLGAGTGSAFSLLPAQNATGNWIKVVQRVPVRIALDGNELTQHPLRVGLSMEATVDIHDTNGRMLAEGGRTQPVATMAMPDQGRGEADAEVKRIIIANSGRGAAAASLARSGSHPVARGDASSARAPAGVAAKDDRHETSPVTPATPAAAIPAANDDRTLLAERRGSASATIK